MVEVNDLLYQGCIVIFMSSDKKIHGSVMIEVGNNYIPLSLTEDDLSIIRMNSGLMKRLENGNVIYMSSGSAYLGNFCNEGPYGEEKIFISEVDVSSLDYVTLLKNLEYKVNNNLGKRKRLIKVGEFYKPTRCNS